MRLMPGPCHKYRMDPKSMSIIRCTADVTHDVANVVNAVASMRNG